MSFEPEWVFIGQRDDDRFMVWASRSPSDSALTPTVEPGVTQDLGDGVTFKPYDQIISYTFTSELDGVVGAVGDSFEAAIEMIRSAWDETDG